VRLHHWSQARRDVEFDAATGSAHVVRLPAPRPDTGPVSGFVAFERALWGRSVPFALYRSGDDLFFSAGRRAWNLGQSRLSFSHGRPIAFVSRFQVLESGRVVFSFWYSHVARLLLEALDPTYNDLDQEHDFFLAFVAQYAATASWQRNVRERWVPAHDGLTSGRS
jgi:hypothetical protein